MRHIAALAAVGVVVLYGGMTAQSQPDFTGTWVVETIERPAPPPGAGPGGGPGGRMRGGSPGGSAGGGPRPADGGGPGRGGMMPQEGQRVRIRQTADRLIVTTALDTGEQMNAYSLDGSESSNATGRGNAKSHTQWEGVALVTDSSQTMADPSGDREMTIRTREVRSLSEDARTMTVRTTADTPRGNRTTTVIYAKVVDEK